MLIDLVTPETIAIAAVGYVKRTYEIRDGRLKPAKVVPLQGIEQLQVFQGDLAPWRVYTDVIVEGDAIAPYGRPTARMKVAVRCGALKKEAVVFGDRFVDPKDERPIFSEPTPFERMPLSWDRSFGGLDPFVPAPKEVVQAFAEGVIVDHPGFYPRNRYGTGYAVVRPRKDRPIPLPNVEDPSDLLKVEDFYRGDPAQWSALPLPWGFGRVMMDMFPRATIIGESPWFDVKMDASLKEVKRGFFNPTWIDSAQIERNPAIQNVLRQEATHGLWLQDAPKALPIEIDGMCEDEPTLRFSLPAHPKLAFILESKRVEVVPKLSSIIIEPNDKRVSLVWSHVIEELPRAYVPKVYRDIPISLMVDDLAYRYETPTPLTDVEAKLRADQAEK